MQTCDSVVLEVCPICIFPFQQLYSKCSLVGDDHVTPRHVAFDMDVSSRGKVLDSYHMRKAWFKIYVSF